jgi:hypothetical protein
VTGRFLWAGALTLTAALALGACGEDPSPLATASPSPSEIPAGPSLLPPPPGSPAPATDTSAAGVALAAAARKTSESGAFRVNITATFKGAGTGPSGTMTGSGETESHSRFHVTLNFTVGTQQLVTESTVYDGVTYGRSSTQPWHVVASSAASADPRGYLGYLTRAIGVRDAGPATREGQPAERYEALVDVGRKSTGPTPSPVPTAAPVLSQVVAWVDLASGRLTEEDINSGPGSATPAQLTIAFSDFGSAIRVVPPIATP